MRIGLAFAVFLSLAATTPLAWGHSAAELESSLAEKEKYFQAIDEDAPQFTLRSMDGRDVQLQDFRGKVVVLYFIFTSCNDICPLHSEKIATVQSMVNESPMKDQVQFVAISTDPSVDTPEVLKEYGPLHGLDPANWMGLTTKDGQAEDVTRMLAGDFGHGFSKTPDGQQAHGIVTHVIDQEGRWRADFHGLEFGPTNMVTYINSLTNSQVPHHDEERSSVWDRIWSFF